MKTNETAMLLAAIGEKGTDPKLTIASPADLLALIGGTIKAVSLDKKTAVFFNGEKQTATLLDPLNLSGVIALCGIDRDGNPAALSTVKQVTKYAKLFRKSSTATKGGE